MGFANKAAAMAAGSSGGGRIRLPRPQVDFWKATDKELVSLVKKMITLAEQEEIEARNNGNAKRAGLLRMALDSSEKKLRAVTSGAVTGTDVGAALREALNVLLNSIYL